MKPFQSLLLAFVLIISFGQINQSYSQTMYFCEGVSDDGEPINAGSHFTIPEDGGSIYVLVQLPYEIDCNEVHLFIYRNGMYDTELFEDSEYDWDRFWYQIPFYESGDYEIKVYHLCTGDGTEVFLAEGSVIIDKE